jgi:deoxyribonuclease V
MHIPHLHDWNISASEAIALQKQLVSQIDYHRPIDLDAVRLVAGVDVSVKTDPITGAATSQAAVVVLSYPDMQVIETSLAQMPTPFPYIPGLLSFREGPVLETAFQKLQAEPDVLIFDGMGRAHPRRIGIASHMGLWLQKPTIGCGKTLLIGHFKEPPNERGGYSDLIDHDEVIGAVLRTRANVKPVFISVGHLADLETSIRLVMACTSKYRLPDPIRAAHNAAGKMD